MSKNVDVIEELRRLPRGEFLAPEEVAKMLKFPRSTVLYLLRNSRLPGIKLGKHWRIPAHGLAEFFENLDVKAAE